MKAFTDDFGREWVAEVGEERTPRHHGKWYLAFRSGGEVLAMPEVKWQTRASGERILNTMADFELRRRLKNVRARNASNDGASGFEGEGAGVARGQRPPDATPRNNAAVPRVNANAG